jgi:hypothetical protein
MVTSKRNNYHHSKIYKFFIPFIRTITESVSAVDGSVIYHSSFLALSQYFNTLILSINTILI